MLVARPIPFTPSDAHTLHPPSLPSSTTSLGEEEQHYRRLDHRDETESEGDDQDHGFERLELGERGGQSVRLQERGGSKDELSMTRPPNECEAGLTGGRTLGCARDHGDRDQRSYPGVDGDNDDLDQQFPILLQVVPPKAARHVHPRHRRSSHPLPPDPRGGKSHPSVLHHQDHPSRYGDEEVEDLYPCVHPFCAQGDR